MSPARSVANRRSLLSGRSLRALAWLVLLAAATSLGCGLGTYEEKLDETTRAYRRRDAEAKLKPKDGPQDPAAAPGQPAAAEPAATDPAPAQP